MEVCRFCYFKIETCLCNKGKIIRERNIKVDFEDYLKVNKINNIMKPLKQKDNETKQTTLI